MRVPRVKAVAAAALLALAAVAAWDASAGAAPAAPTATASAAAPTCPPGQVSRKVTRTVTGKQITVTVCVPGGGGGGGNGGGGDGDGGGGDGGGGGGDNDGNYLVCNPWSVIYPGSDPVPPPGEPPDAIAYACIQYIGGNPQYGPYIPQWLTPEEAALPSPEEVANDLLADVRATLPTPSVVPYPDEAEAALLDVPSFVSVENWQDAYTTDPGCDATGIICVVLELEPALTFDPGDGSPVVDCEPGGTAYDPAAGTPREVADHAGACFRTYDERTGVDGRPGAYEATVTVTWTVTYQQQPAGASGTLDPIPLSEGFSREVEEVQSVGRESGD